MTAAPATPGETQQGVARRAFARTGLSVEELWMRYFALGGDASLLDLEAYLQGLVPLEGLHGDLVAQALNERLDELAGRDRVPYSRRVRDAEPREGPLAALVGLLSGAAAAPPERLPVLAEAAGEALGVRLVTYVVDYEQTRLVPLPSPSAADRGPLDVDATLAGRAFRHVQTVASESEGQPRLWVPLLDGAERLGVLDVMVQEHADLRDPGLRTQCEWVARLLGHLVVACAKRGDRLEVARRARERSVSAELLWSLLPATTAEAGGFTVACALEPSDDVGGDAFDYALSESGASLAIFDAMGHSLRAGLAAAATLAAYREARRRGHGLDQQAQSIDDVLAEQFPDAFCTGVLAELDLASGRLRYLAAGHPPPLVMRDGRVVRALTAGRRLPFGIADRGWSLGEETLEPGDWLMLHTDGVTEARGADGEFFGERRLVDLLTREAAAGQPPPETVRRLAHAVLAHQHGVLQDDATVLLARWDRRVVE